VRADFLSHTHNHSLTQSISISWWSAQTPCNLFTHMQFVHARPAIVIKKLQSKSTRGVSRSAAHCKSFALEVQHCDSCEFVERIGLPVQQITCPRAKENTAEKGTMAAACCADGFLPLKPW